MTEILTYISTLAPGLVSVFGIILSIIVFIQKFKNFLDDVGLEKEKFIAALQESDSAYKHKIDILIQQNAELAEVNAKLVDKLAKIKGYTATKKE